MVRVGYVPDVRVRSARAGSGVALRGLRSTASRATSRGTVSPLAGDTYESERPVVKRTRSGREYQAGVQIVTANWRRPVTSLVAFRCPGCGLDEVFDMDTEECWTLDGSDYGDEGSTA